MGSSDSNQRGYRSDEFATPLHEPDDTLLIVEPSAATRVICVEVARKLGLRPVAASFANTATVAANCRPLVILLDVDPALDRDAIGEVAVSVGAQLVEILPTDTRQSLTERVEAALQAARRLRLPIP